MSMGRQLIAFCFIMIIFWGCKKEKHEIKYFPIPDTLKNAALFQKNSYWVYRNDTTGAIDCTYVKSEAVSFSATYKYNDFMDYTTDNIGMPVQSTLFWNFSISGKLGSRGKFPGYPFLTQLITFNNGPCNPGNTSFVLHDDTLSDHQGENYYDCTQDPKFNIGGGDKFIELGEYQNFIVNDVIFQKVRETRSLFYASFFSAADTKDTIDFYFSPGNGLVKIIFRVDTALSYQTAPKRATMSWSLLRYKVIR